VSTLIVAGIWALVCLFICLFVHGAKRARRTGKWTEEARRNVKWPVRGEME